LVLTGSSEGPLGAEVRLKPLPVEWRTANNNPAGQCNIDAERNQSHNSPAHSITLPAILARSKFKKPVHDMLAHIRVL